MGNRIHLAVIDDGVGIDAEAPERPLSHGLLGMRERIGRLNGQLIIRRGDGGRGTIVEAIVALDEGPPTEEPQTEPAASPRR